MLEYAALFAKQEIIVKSSAELIQAARKEGIVIPAFNIPYLPMVEPVVRAVVDADSLAFLEVARLEWTKFEAKSLKAVMEEYHAHANLDHVRLHLDHIPVIDEDNLAVDYLPIIREALELEFDSVMVDGSRLDLEGNIEATRRVVDLAHEADVACEAELGAILGHGDGPLPPYEELFRTGEGFTDVEEAGRFVKETDCDWLSVAIGNIHGAVSRATRSQKKVTARLDLKQLARLRDVTDVPLVLHGGTGVERDCVLAAIKQGIAKVNVATEIRQAYEESLRETGSVIRAQEAVYERTSWVICEYYGLRGTRVSLSA
jgi:ketose-bisphosphate aldolase